jgi:hypothetical protein
MQFIVFSDIITDEICLQIIEEFDDCGMVLFFYIGHGGLTNMNRQVLLGTDWLIDQAVEVEYIINHLAHIQE